MNGYIPPERASEMLFVAAVMSLREPGSITVFAPSTFEEFSEGYDARLMGANGCHELFLQFKRPNVCTINTIRWKIDKPQLERLRWYPTASAFYVVGTFGSYAELIEAQAAGPMAMLSQYVAVEVQSVTKGHNQALLCGDGSVFDRLETQFRRTRMAALLEGTGRIWRGDELLDAYLDGRIGGRVEFAAQGRVPRISSVFGSPNDLSRPEEDSARGVNPLRQAIGSGVQLRRNWR